MTSVYKIVLRSEWDDAQAAGVFEGSKADLRDGFIHLSAADQAQATACRHFKGIEDLLLLTLDAATLGPALRWEPSFGGGLFPHLYAPLNLSQVQAIRALPLDPDGAPLLGSLEP